MKASASRVLRSAGLMREPWVRMAERKSMCATVDVAGHDKNAGIAKAFHVGQEAGSGTAWSEVRTASGHGIPLPNGSVGRRAMTSDGAYCEPASGMINGQSLFRLYEAGRTRAVLDVTKFGGTS
jgi:hypothetical protein